MSRMTEMCWKYQNGSLRTISRQYIKTADKDTYGHVLLRTSTGYYDESINENIYEEPEFVAESFTAVIHNLKDAEELEEMGLL